MTDTKPSERAMAAAIAVIDGLFVTIDGLEETEVPAAAAIIDEHFRLPELTGEMSSRAIQAGLDIAQLGHETENIVQWGDAGRIIDHHFPGYDELLAACKASAESPHDPTCQLHIPPVRLRGEITICVGPCTCHVGQAQAALAAAKENPNGK